MKRCIPLVLVILAILSSLTAGAESERSNTILMIKEGIGNATSAWCDLYDENSDVLDEDYAEVMYYYYKLYLAASNLYSKELEMNVKETMMTVGSNKVFGVSTAAKGWIDVESIIDAKWKSYVDGEIQLEEFYPWLVSVIKSQVKFNK